jgi:hypothetical protein
VRRRALLAALALASAGAGVAWAQDGFDGTWGGARGELTAQVIVVGGAVIGFYWRGDYIDTADAKRDGAALAFTFSGGRAALTRTGERTARLEVEEAGRLTRLELRKD